MRDCEHGRQLGKCDICDLIAAEMRIEALESFILRYRYRIKGGEKMQMLIDEVLGGKDARCK